MSTNADKDFMEKATPQKTKTSKIFNLPYCETANPVLQKTRKNQKNSQSQPIAKPKESSHLNNQIDQTNPSLMVRNVLQASFDAIGGVEALTEWAQNNPKEFYQLYIKLLALQAKTDPSGDLIIQWQK